MVCKEKSEFLKELKDTIETASKLEVSSENTIIMEILSSMVQMITINECTFQTRGFWRRARDFLKKGRYYLDKDKTLAKKYFEVIMEGVDKVVKYEIWWRNKAVTVLTVSALIAPLVPNITLATYIPLIAIAISLLDVGLGVLALLGGGAAVFIKRPIMGGTYVAMALIGLYEKPLDVKLEEPKLEPEVSEEEVRELFRKLYGREGDEIFEFELKQLIINGYTKKEALIELWKRLTGNNLSSSSNSAKGEHVRSGKGQGAEDHREEGNNA